MSQMIYCSVIEHVCWTKFFSTGSRQRGGRGNWGKEETGKPGTVLGHGARWLFVNMVLKENAIVGELASRESIDLWFHLFHLLKIMCYCELCVSYILNFCS